MKFLLILLTTFSLNLYARSGDGLGNGGLGYLCTLIDSNQKITIALDTAEGLTELYPLSYFKNSYATNRNYMIQLEKDASKTVIDYENSEYDRYGKNLLAIERNLLDMAKQILDLSKIEQMNLLSKKEFTRLKNAKQSLLDDTYIYFHLRRKTAPNNRTNDTGKVLLPNKETLKSYGLKNCSIAQVAVYGYVEIGYQAIVHALRFHWPSFSHMDDFNLKALLWHEVIYQALDDENSVRTRTIVRNIMKEMYPLF